MDSSKMSSANAENNTYDENEKLRCQPESEPLTESKSQSSYQENKEKCCEETAKISFWKKFKKDTLYRRKFIQTVFMWWESVVFGWTTGQIGPSLLDLQFISNTTLRKASAFLTAGSAGYLLGSILTGYFHGKVKGELLLFLCISGNVVMTTVIPWCSLYEIMVTAMVVRNVFFGGYDTVINARMMQTWRTESKFYMQVLHLSFAVGGILSPLATAPFLLNVMKNQNVSDTLVTASTNVKDIQNFVSGGEQIFNSSSNFGTDSGDTNNFQNVTGKESKLYQAYIITSCLLVTAAIPFLLLHLKRRGDNNVEKSQDGSLKKNKTMSFSFKILVLVNLAFLTCFDVAIEKGTHEFITAFCVTQFDWSKSKGSYLNSAFWAAYAFGRFSGIFTIQIIKPHKMIFIYMVGLILSYVGLLVSALFDYDIGLWICLPLSGFCMSIIFPTLFTWTEISLLPVTGAVTSLFVVCGSLGSVLNPIAIGTLMDNVTAMYFCYLLLGESVVLFFLFLSALYLSKTLKTLKEKQKSLTVT